MDPNASLDIINDNQADILDRSIAAEGLAQWLGKGGAFPSSGLPWCGRLTDEAMEALADDEELPPGLLASLQCALANGDLSGLQYLLA